LKKPSKALSNFFTNPSIIIIIMISPSHPTHPIDLTLLGPLLGNMTKPTPSTWLVCHIHTYSSSSPLAH
jgi:hypothetical protein